jgi:pilus assembly protein TadC
LLNGIALIVIALAGVLVYMGIMNWSIRRGALVRLYALDDASASARHDTSARDSALARWLARAGYRQQNAQTIFIAATAGCVLVGLAVSQVYRLVLLRPLLRAIANVPGSAGDLLALVLIAGPWILLIVSGFVPALVVRGARRSRVRAIEQDLPLALELFATMGEAGLGFDAALAKVVRAQGSSRPLASEFLNFQYDMMAGMSRTQALRQLGRRVDVQSLSTFTSALVQAEQVGASMAETLQHQANDLRQRRRENALLQAQALPVKLVFPLVVCFLPGIFATTLAPVLFQMVQVANGVLLSSGR